MSRFVIFIVLLLSQCLGALAIEVPKLERRVTDLAGVLTPQQVAALEAKLKNLEDTDSTQVAVLIIPSLEGEYLEGYSIRVAEQWKLGQKGRDNGAILLDCTADEISEQGIASLRAGELVFDGPGADADEKVFEEIYGRSLTADDTMAKAAAGL
mgnify:CR=1 FL=1